MHIIGLEGGLMDTFWCRIRLSGSLFLVAALLLAAFGPARVARAAGPALVQVINTGAGSSWGPIFSPDPSGITYWPANDTLVIADGEVEEMYVRPLSRAGPVI